MSIEILIVILLILGNGFLATAEIAILSSRKARLKQRADDGDLKAASALKLAEEPMNLLSTVQIGITLVGVLAGAFGGATIAEQIATVFTRISWIAPYSEVIGVSIVVATITYLSLIFGELVPKRLALTNPERYATAMAIPMGTLSRIASPMVKILSSSTNFVLKMMGVESKHDLPVTEEEIKILIEQGTLAGVFKTSEQEMVTRVLRLGDRRIGSLITPRKEIIWLNQEASWEVNQQIIISSNHSIFPVGIGSLDNVNGIVQTKDILTHVLTNQPIDISKFLIEPLFVPDNMPALEVLELLKDTSLHLALVIDEYGGLLGLVTITDMLEAIVGIIKETGTLSEPQIIQREDGSWLLDGMLSIVEFKGLIHIDELPNESHANYETLSGFVMAYLGRIPVSGDHFEWGDLYFEVMDMDGFRVDKLLVKPLK